MQHLVFYKTQNGITGNIDCKFIHNPPCIEDVRSLEKDITERYCNGVPAIVTGWEEIQSIDDLEKSNWSDHINITIRGEKIEPGDRVVISDDKGVCWYDVGLGSYEYDGKTHIGWYLTLKIRSDDYPKDEILLIRSIADLVYDKDIIEWNLIHKEDL